MLWIWNFLNGKKTFLGLFLGVVYYGLLSQNLISPSQIDVAIITSLTGVGLAHKAIKA